MQNNMQSSQPASRHPHDSHFDSYIKMQYDLNWLKVIQQVELTPPQMMLVDAAECEGFLKTSSIALMIALLVTCNCKLLEYRLYCTATIFEREKIITGSGLQQG